MSLELLVIIFSMTSLSTAVAIVYAIERAISFVQRWKAAEEAKLQQRRAEYVKLFGELAESKKGKGWDDFDDPSSTKGYNS